MGNRFGKEQLILARSMANGVSKIYLDTFENIGKTKDGPDRNNFKVFHNGSWCPGTRVKVKKETIYRIVTANNKELYVTENTLNITLRGNIETQNLKKEDYLLFNTRELSSYCEQDLHLTYEHGFVVGLFLGCGNLGRNLHLVNGVTAISEVQFSLNENNYLYCKDIIDKTNMLLGSKKTATTPKPYFNCYPVRISSKKLANFLIYWTNWSRETRSNNISLNMECLLQSIDFRKGILDGWHVSDGDVSDNRCFTTSQQFATQIETLITSLGKVSKVDVVDTIDKIGSIRGKTFKHNYPIYKVRWYELTNRRSISNVYKIFNNSIYFKIKSIEKLGLDNTYSFEMNNKEEPFFTLPNGMIVYSGE